MAYDNTEIDQSGNAEEIERAKKNQSLRQRLTESIMGSEKANQAAQARQEEAAKKYPEGPEAKFQKVKKSLGFKSGGKVSSASKRADGCAQRGKTKGKMV